MYTVMHRNGVGDTKSQWYIDLSGVSWETADIAAMTLESQTADGWNLEVRVVTDEEALELTKA